MLSDEARRVLDEALRLSPELRAAIAGTLLESLDDSVDPDVESAWARELAQRVRELDEGRVTPVPWAEVRRRMLEDA